MAREKDTTPAVRKPKRGNNEGSVSQRKDGRWCAVVSVPGLGGARTRKFLYAPTRAEASAKLTKVLRDLQLGLTPVNERTTTAQFLTAWLKDSVRANHRPNTYSGYEANARLHLIPYIGNVPVGRLTPDHPRKTFAALTQKGLSPRTIQYVRAVLRSALKQAEADGIVHRNVAELVSGPTVERKAVSPLSPAEVRAFLDGVGCDRLSALYVVAYTLGLRQSEILGLRWADIDLEAGTLRVAQTLARGKGVAFGAPKSDRSRRTLMLPAFTASALRAHRTRQNAERLRAGSEWRDYGLLCTTAAGTPIDHRNLSRYFQSHLRRLGLPPQRFHDARHACATFLLSEGVQLRVVQEILGHSQIAITADLYAHVLPALQRDAMSHIDRAFAAL